MLNRMKIVTRLAIGFSLMLLGALVLGFLGARSITQMSAISSDILRHPLAVTSAVLEVRADVLATHKMAGELVSKASLSATDPLQHKLSRTTVRIGQNMATVRQRFAGNPAEIGQIDKALADWQAARDETLALARGGRRAEATALNEGRDARLVDAVLQEVGDVADFAAANAVRLEQAAAAERDTAMATIASTT